MAGEVDTVRCGATLVHAHGTSRCTRTPMHDDHRDDAYGPLLDQHLGTCPVCEDDGDPDPWLRWTGYREQWVTW